MRRITPDNIRQFNPGLTNLAIIATITSEQNLKFTGITTCLANDPALPASAATNQSCEISDPSGRFKDWSDIDSMVRAVVKANPTINAVTVSVDTTKLQPKVSLTATPIQIAASQKSALEKRVAPQVKRVNDAVAYLVKIAAYQTGNVTQQALYAEAVKKKLAADELLRFINAEIARLALVLP